ncbi:hypothetical protein [Azospirillum griseum]|uniref:Uncharacterized protein n=1 Tax=Azospirillum griseum TaxID=2496639 RepID=A0A3S0HXJ7_9PROT|nr:hypothetical protein [Azospirillum griseum]RTR15675.1 hypothetical protein EJ903_22580 [Azospirillum griseum]
MESHAGNEHVSNIFFPTVVRAPDRSVVLYGVSGDIYNNQSGSLSITGSLNHHLKILESIREKEAQTNKHHRMMDRRAIISAHHNESRAYAIEGSSCLLALVLMDRALRWPRMRLARRVIATGSVTPDGAVSAISPDNTADYLAKFKHVEWQKGDLFICPADGLTTELKEALERVRERGVEVHCIDHLDTLWKLCQVESPLSSPETPETPKAPETPDTPPKPWWKTTNKAAMVWGTALSAVILIAILGSLETSPSAPPVEHVTLQTALGINVLLEPKDGGEAIRTLAGHVFTQGDRVGLELEASEAGQVAVFDTSSGASASPTLLAMAKVGERQRLLLPTTGSWTLDGAPGVTQTLTVAFAACGTAACPPDFKTEAQSAIRQSHSIPTLSPPGRVSLINRDRQVAVARIALSY